jgi:hypothetical protein
LLSDEKEKDSKKDDSKVLGKESVELRGVVNLLGLLLITSSLNNILKSFDLNGNQLKELWQELKSSNLFS